MDFKGRYNEKLRRPMFGQSFLAHLPHSELAAGTKYLERGKQFFKVCLISNIPTRPFMPFFFCSNTSTTKPQQTFSSAVMARPLNSRR
jgi:hypothetical protein